MYNIAPALVYAFSFLLENCKNCSNCIGCKNLRGKSYHIYNEPVTKEEFDTIREGIDYNFDFHSENLHMFQGYIDESYSCFQLVDEENYTYKRAVYDFLNDHFKDKLKDIDYEMYFKNGIFTDYMINKEWYESKQETQEQHRQKWLDKFRSADQELYLLLEWH